MKQCYSQPLRILHLLLAVGISVQLLLSLVMEVPKPGRPINAFTDFLYVIHANVGVVVLVILVAHWLLFVLGHARFGIAHFFPWFSRARLDDLIQEVKELASAFRLSNPARRNMPRFSQAWRGEFIREIEKAARTLPLRDPETRNALAGGVEGLGLLLASLLALSGLVLYFGIAGNGAMSSGVHSIKEIHETLGLFMWGYLAIHAGAALFHRFVLDHRTILSIFNVRK